MTEWDDNAPEGSWQVDAPDGESFEVRCERAPQVTAFMSTPWRVANTISGDASWHITVESDRVAWPVLREKCRDGAAATERVEALVREISTGRFNSSARPWRRRQLDP